MDDQLEGLAALDDEAEYQRFLAGLRGGPGGGAAFSSFLDEEEDEGEGAQEGAPLQLLCGVAWEGTPPRLPRALPLCSLAHLRGGARRCAIRSRQRLQLLRLPGAPCQMQTMPTSIKSCEPCWACLATRCRGRRHLAASGGASRCGGAVRRCWTGLGPASARPGASWQPGGAHRAAPCPTTSHCTMLRRHRPHPISHPSPVVQGSHAGSDCGSPRAPPGPAGGRRFCGAGGAAAAPAGAQA